MPAIMKTQNSKLKTQNLYTIILTTGDAKEGSQTKMYRSLGYLSGRTRKLRYSMGQSILEVLIALTLIIFFLSGVVIIQLFAVRNVTYSENKSTAAKLARQQLDRVKVVRDSAGIDSLDRCKSSCFINSQLTPVQRVITPTGSFDQIVTLETATINDCPPPDVTPTPVSYKVTAVVYLKGAAPTPLAQLSSCITDWR
ncbi:hypothetical protein HY029_02420 [Candidatus Gottesmanbacteria bacterium]|nr:hypothetical protein [Candidatus Gottesmanbacteria bacterium]